MAKNPDTPKKPGKTPKSRAHRPEVQPIGPALAELLNPAINRGDAGMGSGTGLQPPPDNSWDRRASGEAAPPRNKMEARRQGDGRSAGVADPRGPPRIQGRRLSCESGRRTARRARRNPKAACRFEIKSEYEPKGDQPTAIKELVEGVERATTAPRCCSASPARARPSPWRKVIEATQRPALILAPNKTLAAQLYGEFKSFFPDNAVEYFVSYYDYYQPEAYVPRTDTYIEKESSINEQIDRMRHSATRALLERDDVIIVASVSCIYGIGSVETYTAMTFALKKGEKIDQRQLIADLVALQYKRGDRPISSAAPSACAATSSTSSRPTMRTAPGASNLFGDEVESIIEVRSAHRPQAADLNSSRSTPIRTT